MEGFANIYYVFLGLGIIGLLIGGVQIPIEAKEDNILIAKKLAFLILVILAMVTFKPTLDYITDTTYSLRDIAVGDVFSLDSAELAKQLKDKDDVKDVSPFFNPGKLFSSFLKKFVSGILWALLYIPRFFRTLGISLVAMVIATFSIISPFMLSMLTIKQLEGAGWRFFTASIALSLSPLVFPIVDYIFINFAGRIVVAFLATMFPAALGAGVGLAEAVVVLVGLTSSNPIGWTILIVLICVCFMLAVFMFIFCCAGYVITPFIFVRMLSSGDVVAGFSGAFSTMTGHAQRGAGIITEGAEAGARIVSKANKAAAERAAEAQAINGVVVGAGLPNEATSSALAKKALSMASGNVQTAIQLAQQMDKNRFTTPSGTYREEPLPAGMKKIV